MPKISWCKVINLIHNRHLSTYFNNIGLTIILFNMKNKLFFMKTFIKIIIPMKNRIGHPATACDDRAMHEQVVTRAWIV